MWPGARKNALKSNGPLRPEGLQLARDAAQCGKGPPDLAAGGGKGALHTLQPVYQQSVKAQGTQSSTGAPPE